MTEMTSEKVLKSVCKWLHLFCALQYLYCLSSNILAAKCCTSFDSGGLVSKTTTAYKRTHLNLIFRPLFVSYLYNKVKYSLLSITFFVLLRVFSPFPSSLRFLIQQHLELLHTLQERVLKCQWQGIMGDVFMRLTSKEVKHKLRVYNREWLVWNPVDFLVCLSTFLEQFAKMKLTFSCWHEVHDAAAFHAFPFIFL